MASWIVERSRPWRSWNNFPSVVKFVSKNELTREIVDSDGGDVGDPARTAMCNKTPFIPPRQSGHFNLLIPVNPPVTPASPSLPIKHPNSFFSVLSSTSLTRLGTESCR